ncbi:MAG TPA: thioredoxin-like domain-containing protein, partial [Gammaproteobacteria bacterium]|nr:thioredoxin-like domain-containing protein [Gammaproteobacteria bacterium]
MHYLMQTLKKTTFLILALLIAGMLVAGLRWAGGVGPLAMVVAAEVPESYAGKQTAPEFPTGLDWINTGGKPLSLAQLRGKVVLLDFWTYGCINCFHVIPDLKRLEAKYPHSLVIVGVHSAKFATEGKTAHIAAIVQRYGLKHPVVNDHDLAIWNEFGATGWPTLTVIDPAGKVVGEVSGEGHYELLDRVIGGLTKEFGARKELDTRPLWFEGQQAAMPAT